MHILTLRAPSQCQGMDLGGGEADSFKAWLSMGLHRKFVQSLWGCWRGMTIPESFSTIRDLSTIHSMFTFNMLNFVSSIHVSPNILSNLSSFYILRNPVAVKKLLEKKIVLCNMPRKINNWRLKGQLLRNRRIEGSNRHKEIFSSKMRLSIRQDKKFLISGSCGSNSVIIK